MGERLRGCIVITHNRPELLAQTIAAIRPQVDVILVLDNASSPPATVPPGVNILYIPDQPPNIAKIWNHGFDWYQNLLELRQRYSELDSTHGLDIAMLCDDAIVPDGWFAAVTEGMRLTGAATGCSNPWGTPHQAHIKTTPDHDIAGRMIGWAFVVDADKGLRADESMHWWWVDTDIDWQARAAGGFVMVGGYSVPNVQPGEYTNIVPGLGARTGQDREAFVLKYGTAPW